MRRPHRHIDIHLLDGDDPDACLARAHESFTHDITPGRYFIVADTYTDGVDKYHGAYNLTVTLTEGRFNSRLLIVSRAGTMSVNETLEAQHFYFAQTIKRLVDRDD